MARCILFSFLTIVSLQAISQAGIDLKSVKKKINKTNRSLAIEFAAIKLIPTKNSTDNFYISPYEVTNKQYREFLEYIQDSILRKLMNYVKQGDDGNEYLDHSKKIDITRIAKSEEKADVFFVSLQDFPLTPLLINTNGVFHLRLRSFIYSYGIEEKWRKVTVMPDTICWRLGATYYLKKPVTTDDFWQPSLNNYPVTGVSFYQAQAYCHWKTQQLKKALGSSNEFDITISLPTTSQLETAVRSGQLPGNYSRSRSGQGANCNFFSIHDINGYIIKSPGEEVGMQDEAIGFRYVVLFKRKKNDDQ